MLLHFGACIKQEYADKCAKYRIVLYLQGKLAETKPVLIDNSGVEPYLARPNDDNDPSGS